jgi:HrpA-like RNA helicase
MIIQLGSVNPFNKTPFSATYKDILKDRQKLPVFGKMHEFYETVRKVFTRAQMNFIQSNVLFQYSSNQVLVVIGETGAGKTTQ